MKIKNIVFDIGNVLVGFDPKTYIEKTFPHTAAKLVTIFFSTGIWQEVDLNVLDDAEIVKLLIKQDPSLSKEISYLYEHMENFLYPYQDSERFLQSLHEYNLYYLSNYGETMYAKTKNLLTFLKEFKGGVFSFDVKIVKPDRRIYDILLDTYHLNKDKTVFLDDSLENCQTAIRLGIHAIHVKERATAFHQLKTFLKSDNR